EELKLSVGRILLIVNKVPNGVMNDGVKEEIEKHNLELIGVVPMDELIYEYDSTGIPLVNLPEDSKSKVAMKEIFAKLELK
ncbi:TPA: carbon monoxide dehydrogenase, partial [Clostridioides difficile]|nr:carbon monoxide dehydrogenase [Clostridioides difficile]